MHIFAHHQHIWKMHETRQLKPPPDWLPEVHSAADLGEYLRCCETLCLSWLWHRNGLLLFFHYLPFPPLFSLRLILCTEPGLPFCLLIRVDSHCTIMTHPRNLVLGPEGCTMTHGLIPWLTLFTLVCYRLRVLNNKYLIVAVVGP